MRVIVIPMNSTRLDLHVGQTIVQVQLGLIGLTVASMQLLEINIFVHLEFIVEKMKEIVMLMMNVKMVLFVDQTVAQIILVWTLQLIVVTNA